MFLKDPKIMSIQSTVVLLSAVFTLVVPYWNILKK